MEQTRLIDLVYDNVQRTHLNARSDEGTNLSLTVALAEHPTSKVRFISGVTGIKQVTSPPSASYVDMIHLMSGR